MIRSMTGYGKAEAQIGSKKYTVELRSLNSKQFDLNVRMPSVFKEKEMKLRNGLASKIVRGKADLTIFYDTTADEKKVSVNRSLMLAYHEDLKGVAEEINQEQVDYMSLLMRIPDVLKTEREELNEDEWKQISGLVEGAVKMFNEYRTQEGEILEKDFETRVRRILELEGTLDSPIESRGERVKNRIKDNIAEAVDPNQIDQNRFEQELIYYVEKMDVTEERVRLKANCEYFLEILEKGESQGKKLGFITQEMGREINTLGSKANDADIQRIVVQMKDELEKVKEQVLNVI